MDLAQSINTVCVPANTWLTAEAARARFALSASRSGVIDQLLVCRGPAEYTAPANFCRAQYLIATGEFIETNTGKVLRDVESCLPIREDD